MTVLMLGVGQMAHLFVPHGVSTKEALCGRDVPPVNVYYYRIYMVVLLDEDLHSMRVQVLGVHRNNVVNRFHDTPAMLGT